MSIPIPASVFCHLNEQGSLCLGDSIIHLPFLRALREWAPQAEITVFPQKGGVRSLDPIYSKYITRAVGRLPSRENGDTFDWVFDLVGENLRTGRQLRSMAKMRFFSTAARGWFHLPELPLYHGKHVVRRHLRLLKQATGFELESFWPWPLPPAYLERASDLLPDGARYIGIAPGAGNAGRNKRWPLERYVALALDLSEEGYVPVVFLGPEEAGWDAHFAAVPNVRFPEAENAARGDGCAGPSLVVALASRLAAAVTNCCGSGHMFALGAAPLVTLFGPTSFEKFAPFCRRGVCVLPRDAGIKRMEDVHAADVVAAVRWAAERGRPASALAGPAYRHVSFPDIDMNR